MNYNIENVDVIKNKEEKAELEKQLEKFVGRFNYIPKKYLTSDLISIYISQTKNGKYEISFTININNRKIGISKQFNHVTDLVPLVYDEFSQKVEEEINQARQEYSPSKKISFIEATNISNEKLKKLSQPEKDKLFRTLILATLPDMIGYIKRRVYSARLAEIRQFSNVFVKDIVSEVIIKVHDRFQKNTSNVKEFNLWNIQESDKILNEILENRYMPGADLSYEQMLNTELRELEEDYSIDGGGDIVMNEENDNWEVSAEVRYENPRYPIDNESLEKIDNETVQDELEYDELIKLPLKYQTIYDLYYFQSMEIEEIGKIKGLEPIEVEAILQAVRELIAEKS